MAGPRRSDGGGVDVFARRLELDTGVARAAMSPRSGSPSTPAAGVRRGHRADVFVKGAPTPCSPCAAGHRCATTVLDELTATGTTCLGGGGAKARAGIRPPRFFGRGRARPAPAGAPGDAGPARPDVVEAIQACRRAGVNVAMITGDSRPPPPPLRPRSASARRTDLSSPGRSSRTTTRCWGHSRPGWRRRGPVSPSRSCASRGLRAPVMSWR